MATAVRSPLSVLLSKDTSDSLLSYVAEAGDSSPEAVTQFVEDVVSRHLIKLRIDKIRERFSDMSPEQIEELVEEAIAWARSPEGRACE